MATAMFHKSIATIQLNSSGNEWSTCKKLGKYPLKIISKAFVVDVGGSFIYGQSKLHGVHALSSQSPLMDLVSSFSQNTNDYKNNTSGDEDMCCFQERHRGSCRSLQENKQYTCRHDLYVVIDSSTDDSYACHDKHRHKKVPIIIRKESDRAKEWSQVFSEETKRQSIPVITAWELNERILILKQAFLLFKYGELQGHNKLETAERYGKEKVHEWRRSCDSPPANGESLKMCSQRAVAYFREHVTSLELSTGIPLLYIYKEGEFLRRGSPVGSKEAGVYAYSKKMQLNRSLYFATCRVLPFTGRHWMHCFSNTCRKSFLSCTSTFSSILEVQWEDYIHMVKSIVVVTILASSPIQLEVNAASNLDLTDPSIASNHHWQFPPCATQPSSLFASAIGSLGSLAGDPE
ncbi:hypothetical protein GOBAR_AA01748 [Gossypium barbadense]|uniref:Uncharacterized protein n=1 Tax=Gossypium barbadense TaxID=3634 RepID=A0A2P5YTC7_GOSBA|nr:hypothetical protein GOBAR_AA01748 [Gossypium barbadense]